MEALLFEKPLLLGVLLAAGLLALAGLWSRSRSRTASRALLGGLTLSCLLMLGQWLIQTDREKLEARLHAMANTVAGGRVGDIAAFIAPQAHFESGRYTREDFESKLTQLLGQCTIQNPTVSGFQIEMGPGHAVVSCRSSCTVQTSSWTSRVPSAWRFEFTMQNGTWLITDLRPQEIAGQRYTSFWDIDIP